MSGHTPGPWAWDNTPHGARLMAQHSGRLLVMDCARKGMRDAEPRFSDRNGELRGGLMHPASNLDLHEHPDARLIAAAPDLLAACEVFAEWLEREDEGPQYPEGVTRDTPEGKRVWREWWDTNQSLVGQAMKDARAAIAKATGGEP